jgi:hypothetical protein
VIFWELVGSSIKELYAIDHHTPIFGSSSYLMDQGTSGEDYFSGQFGQHIIVGDDGRDHADYQINQSGFGVNVNLASGIVKIQNSSGEFVDKDILIEVESVGGTSFNDVYGGHGDDFMLGNQHSNELWGNDGNDKIDGDCGNDYLLDILTTQNNKELTAFASL